MKQQCVADRKNRTRGLIQIGGLCQRSGLMEAFSIEPGDDLQDYENCEKAAQLLGFLSMCFENNSFNEDDLEQWKVVGERLLRGGS